MQNTEVLNPGCECNYAWLEITRRCGVRIPGSHGQRPYRASHGRFMSRQKCALCESYCFLAAGTGIFNICPGKVRSAAWRSGPATGTGPRQLIFPPPPCRTRVALWPGCATSSQGHCGRGTRCQGRCGRGGRAQSCSLASRFGVVVGRIQPLRCCCAWSHAGWGGGSCLGWVRWERGCFPSGIQLWHLLLPQ